MTKNYQTILDAFPLKGEVVSVEPFGNGHINDTLRVTVKDSDGTEQIRYVLQRINHQVFQYVETLQRNIFTVTEHIRKKLEAEGDADVDRHVCTFLRTKSGERYTAYEGNYWRVMLYIPGSVTVDAVTPESARSAGRAFGDFQSRLSDIPEGTLGDTIPHFHNMAFRLQELADAIKEDRVGRVQEERVKKLIKAIDDRSDDMLLQERLYEEGTLPKHINHLDTKVDNILFDKETGEVLTVIDLDTVMPGFILSDVGDFIRTAVNTGAEDETDESKIEVDMEIFKSYVEGYMSSASSFLSETEIRLIPYGGRMMTYMQAVRFLTDYINGDTYYKTNYKDHNWDRAWAQYVYLTRLEERAKEMSDFMAHWL